MNIIQSLENLDLNEKEARIYIALLQIGQTTAYGVAKHSGLKKPTAYFILDELIKKGVVTKIPRTNTREFKAISPEELFSVARARLEVAEKETMPELKALHKGKDYNVGVTYYEGLEGIKQMYEKLKKVMRQKEMIGFYAHEKDTPIELKKYWRDTIEDFKKLNIKRRAITTKDPSIDFILQKEAMNKYKINLKALDKKEYSSNISIEVYENCTQIISHRYLQGILIDNPDVANVIKQLFEMIWRRDE